jgi:hypothetical protein
MLDVKVVTSPAAGSQESKAVGKVRKRVAAADDRDLLTGMLDLDRVPVAFDPNCDDGAIVWGHFHRLQILDHDSVCELRERIAWTGQREPRSCVSNLKQRKPTCRHTYIIDNGRSNLDCWVGLHRAATEFLVVDQTGSAMLVHTPFLCVEALAGLRVI